MFFSKTYFNHELDTDKYNGPFDELWEWDSVLGCSYKWVRGKKQRFNSQRERTNLFEVNSITQSTNH